jgi:hypothetical protein
VALAKAMTAVALTKGATASASTLTLINGALKIMAWTKMKTAVVVGTVLILAAGTTTVIVKLPSRHPAANQQSEIAAEEAFRQESMARMNEGKQCALAFIMYADDNQNELPKNFDQTKRYFKKGDSSYSNWEIVSTGSLKSITDSTRVMRTILLREKKPRQSPDGTYCKAYAFLDGHVELVSSPDGDFESLEKQRGFLAVPGKN